MNSTFFRFRQNNSGGKFNPPIVNWDAMPAWANWVAMDVDARWFWYECEPKIVLTTFCHESASMVGSIPAAFAPTFTGDWKDSLTQRPQ